MKAFITYILILNTFNIISQSFTFNEDTITKYFVSNLDSFRQNLYPSVPNVIVNKNASIACEHHNNYMTNMVRANYLFCSHGEFKNTDGYNYVGEDTIISNYADRVKYFNTKKDFGSYAEVITAEFLNYYINNGKDDQYLAKVLFMNFVKSPEHNKIISNYSYNVIAIDVKINDNSIYLTMVVGVVINRTSETEYTVIKNN